MGPIDTEQEALTQGLCDLALAGRISWQTVDSLVNAPQATERPELPSEVLATCQRIYEALGGRGRPDWNRVEPFTDVPQTRTEPFVAPTRDVWTTGTTVMESLQLEISEINPSDHSGVRARTRDELLEDLRRLRKLPDSVWKRERVLVTTKALR